MKEHGNDVGKQWRKGTEREEVVRLVESGRSPRGGETWPGLDVGREHLQADRLQSLGPMLWGIGRLRL